MKTKKIISKLSIIQIEYLAIWDLWWLTMVNWNLIIFVSKMAHYWWPRSKLLGALWRRGGKRKKRLQLRLWKSNSTANSLWLPVDWAVRFQRESDMSANVNKHWKARAKGNDVIANVISANQDFTSTFLRRYSNSRDVVASSPSFSRLAARSPRRAF